MNKYVIYTSLTGGYDNLTQYTSLHPNFDYICFSNDYPANTKIGQWLIKPIPYYNDHTTRLSRFVKLMPHTVLKDYEYSVWLDANLKITDASIYNIIIAKINEGGEWYGIQHPEFDCLYDDAKKCITSGKAKYSEIAPQIKYIKSQNYPKHVGLFENNFIIRKHNSSNIIAIDEMWWDLYQRFSPRDQLSLFFVFWKLNFTPQLILQSEQNTHNIDSILFIRHKPIGFLKRIKRKLIQLRNRFFLYIYS